MKKELDAIESSEAPEREAVVARPAHAAAPQAGGGPEKTAESIKPSPNPRPPRITPDDDEEDDESFFQRHRTKMIAGSVVLILGAWMALRKPSGPSAPARRSEPQTIKIQPLPPLPPVPTPPPKVVPPPPKDEKKDDTLTIPQDKPVAPAPPKPVEKPPEGFGTNIKGPGAGLSGLGSGSGNGMIGGTGTGPGGGGSAGAWYAGQVQSRIAEALRNNRKTRSASIAGIKFVVSVDATGRVTGVKLLGSTGDAALDEVIKSEANGIRLQDPPPGGKPMTVTMLLNARRTR